MGELASGNSTRIGQPSRNHEQRAGKSVFQEQIYFRLRPPCVDADNVFPPKRFQVVLQPEDERRVASFAQQHADVGLVLLAVDLIYAAVDPRIKSAYIGKKKKKKVTA